MATTTRKSPRRWALLPGALLALAFCASAAQAVSTQPVDDMWVVDSPRGVTSMIRSGNLLYLGGDFTTMGGASRTRLAAVSTATGTATGFNPGANGAVSSLALSGSTLYAGGSFTSLGGQPRLRFGAVSTATAAATALRSDASSSVNAVVANGSAVFAGGSFNIIGGVQRMGVAALDLTTGQATSLNPNVVPHQRRRRPGRRHGPVGLDAVHRR